MERKSGKPRGEPDYYHDLVTNNTYLLDDPRISEPVELEEREVWHTPKIGRSVR